MLSVLVRRLSDLSSPDKTDSASSEALVGGAAVDIAIVATLSEMTDANDVDDDGKSRATGRRRRDRAAVAVDNMVMVRVLVLVLVLLAVLDC